mgnify:CR=1 FL=1
MLIQPYARVNYNKSDSIYNLVNSNNTRRSHLDMMLYPIENITDIVRDSTDPIIIDIDTTNDKLFNKLKEEICKILKLIAKYFIKSNKIDELGVDIDDLQFTGSLANYNYKDISDVDLHIIIDFDKVDMDEVFKGYGYFCFRLIYRLKKKGVKMKEIPFMYQERRYGESKTVIQQIGWSYFKETLKLRLGL